MNRKDLRDKHFQDVQTILEDYRKVLRVIESEKWTGQHQTTCAVCNNMIKKHGYKNDLHKLAKRSFRIKMALTGQLRYKRSLLEILDTATSELEAKINAKVEDLRDRPGYIGYGSEESTKSLSVIHKEIAEVLKSREEISKRSVQE